jgi:hypothetical protein
MIFQNSTSATINTWTRAFAFIIAGTAAITNNSADVTGTSTTFTTSFVLGDSIILQNQKRQIVKINSDTSLTVDNSFSTTASGLTIENMPMRYNLNGYNKVLTFLPHSSNSVDIILAESFNGNNADISTTVASMPLAAGQAIAPLVFQNLANVFVQSAGISQKFSIKINQ